MTGGVASKEFEIDATDGDATYTNETWGTYCETDTAKEAGFSVIIKQNKTGLDPVIFTDQHEAIRYTKSSTTIKQWGKYYTYLRNYTGDRMKGDITITIK